MDLKDLKKYQDFYDQELCYEAALICCLDEYMRYDEQIIDFFKRKMLERNLVVFIVSSKEGVHMKKFIKIACILAAGIATPLGAAVSQTFMPAETLFRKAMPVRTAFFKNDLLEECCCNTWGGAFQVVFYGSRTTKGEGSEKLVKYFLPPTSTGCCLNVQEYQETFEQSLSNTATPPNEGASADYSRLKDIEARHLNIETVNGATGAATAGSFNSRACFFAQRTVFGVGFNYKQKLSLKKNGATGFWGEIALPVERVNNKIVINEQITNNGGGPLLTVPGLDNSPHVDSVKEAFRQANWNYGKIDPRCQHSQWGVADIELIIGYNTYATECASVDSFAGLVAPTGNKVRGRTLFENVVGNGRHWGVMFGNSIAFDWYRGSCFDIHWYLEMASRYYFENKQVRSFDLNGKYWSRYMEVYSSPEQANAAFTQAATNAEAATAAGTSGINVFTQCVKVTPRFSTVINQAIIFSGLRSCWIWSAEIGYNLYARQQETIKLLDCDPLRGVYLKGVDGAGSATTARTIKANYRDSVVFFSDPNYTRLELSAADINLDSIAAPAAISHIMYAMVGIKRNQNCPCFAGLGASYEFQPREINTLFDRWTVWVKGGITF